MNQDRNDGDLEKAGTTVDVESCAQVLDILKVEPRLADRLDVGYRRKSRVKDNQKGFDPEQLEVCSCQLWRWEKYLEGHICVGGRTVVGL